MTLYKVKYSPTEYYKNHKEYKYKAYTKGALSAMLHSPYRKPLAYCPDRQCTRDKYTCYLKEPK